MPHHRRVKPHISSTVIPQIAIEPSQRYMQYKIKQWLCRALMAKAQVEKLYVVILASLCKQELTEKQRKALLSCKSLAPGDFAAVRSQFWLEDDISHTTLIEALIREQKSKLDSVGKVMGFK